MSTLAGLGRSGAWQVDIDNEEAAGHQYDWSVTFSHPSCHIQWGIADLATIQSIDHHLSCSGQPEVMHKIPGVFGADLFIGIIDAQLIIQSRGYSQSNTPSFQWLMEVSLPGCEVKDLVVAFRDALQEAA